MKRYIYLTIIIPCYNVEKYIAECLDSIYNQDIKWNDYEIICVNDCSTDSTRELIVRYQEAHDNLRLINHSVNKKQGGARNTGLKVANGEYIWFIDSDDYIKPNVLNKLLSICIDNQLEVLQFNYDKVSSQNVYQYTKKNVYDTVAMTGVEFANLLGNEFLNKYDLSVCSRIVKTEFIRKQNIQFLENTIFEDLEFSLRTFLLSNKIQAISDSYYCYRNNPESTMNEISKVVNGKYIFQTCLIIGKGIIDLSDDLKKIDQETSRIIFESGVWRINKMTKPIMKASNKERIEFYSLLKDNKVLKNDIYLYLNKTNRINVMNELIVRNVLFITTPFLNLIRFLIKL